MTRSQLGKRERLSFRFMHFSLVSWLCKSLR